MSEELVWTMGIGLVWGTEGRVRDRAREEGGDTAVARWPGSGCPKEHLREIGRWVREAGLDTQAGWELRGPGVMSEGSRVVVRGEGPADTKGEGRDQVRLRVIGRWK